MKTFLFTLALTTLTFFHCNAQNLITNPDFENSGQLDCQSWYDECGREMTFLCDTITPDTTCYAMFYQDAPPAGGSWSLGVTGVGNSPENYANTYISGHSGSHIYELKVWVKDIGYATGGAKLEIESQGHLSTHKYFMANQSDWSLYTLTDTLTLQPSDSLVISLYAIAAGPTTGNAYFDLVQLKVNDSLSGLPNLAEAGKEITPYPNPFTGYTVFNMPVEMHEAISFDLFDIQGRKIKSFQNISSKSFYLSSEGLSKGLYFYKIYCSKNLLGIGKIVVE